MSSQIGILASDYFDRLYDYAIQLIKLDKAYVCELSGDEIRTYRGTLTEPGKESPFRNRTIEENLDLFQRMKDGEFDEGSRVLRAKIDMGSPNLNMRDPVIYRILKVAHHRTGDTWCIYPMYDYTHCLSDAIEGITHSLCTLEFEDHRPLYDWCLDTLKTPCHPRQIEFARLNLTSAGGVFDDNPLENPDARFVPIIENISDLNLQSMCRGKTGAGTGGMLSKLMAARRAATIGVPTLIVSGRQKHVLERVFDLEDLGTWIAPTQKMLSGRKFWLAYHLDPAGTIMVDDGAARALTGKGKSLLAAGIAGVEGNFGMGALVRIVGLDGGAVGVGLTNFKAVELRKIQGLSSSEIEKILGPCPHQEVVHRDNMVLDSSL